MEKFAICKKCGSLIKLSADNTYWDEKGYGYSTKLAICNECKTHNVLRYEEDNWIKEAHRRRKKKW